MAQGREPIQLSKKLSEQHSALRALVRMLIETRCQPVSLAKISAALDDEYDDDLKRRLCELTGGNVGKYGLEEFLNGRKANRTADDAFYRLLKPVVARLIRKNVSTDWLPHYVSCCIGTVYPDGELGACTLLRSDAKNILDYTRLSQAAFDVISKQYKGLWWVYRLSTQSSRLFRTLIEKQSSEKNIIDGLLENADKILVNKMLLRIQPKIGDLSPRFNLYAHSSTTPTKSPTKSTGPIIFVSDRIYFVGHNDLGEVQPATYFAFMTWQHVTEEGDTHTREEHKGLFRFGMASLRNSANQQVTAYLHASRIPNTEQLDEDKVEVRKNELKEEVRLHTLSGLLAAASPDKHEALCRLLRNSATDLVYYIGGNR